MTSRTSALALAAALALGFAAHATASDKRTVCTITVNSADEREVFKRHLPPDRYEFVELVEHGRRDWLDSACRRKVRCDVLVVSGHFAGSDFYSSKPDTEYLPVDEMERVPCSDTCPDMFAHLKEVYLFGCDTLKPEPVKTATPEIVRELVRAGHSKSEAERIARTLSERHAESSRARMRRIFANVPVIYGFSSLAPYGRVAGPMLNRHFEGGTDAEVGSGRVSARLLSLFAPASMVVTAGMRESDPHADHRAEICRFYDDRLTRAAKLGVVHEWLRGESRELRMAFDRIEKFFATLPAEERATEAFSNALAAIVADAATRSRYLTLVRETGDPALRVRMVELGRSIGWLSALEERGELVRLVRDVLAQGGADYSEVDLICGLNKAGDLDGEPQRFASLPVKYTAQAAALACLGSAEHRSLTLRSLASTDENDVRIAQAYLRHRPIDDGAELRTVVLGIVGMKGFAAQARALGTLARHHIGDREILDELTRLFARTPSALVQQAIAEVFLRADAAAVATRERLGVLRQHRRKPPQAGADLVEVLLGKVTAAD